MPIRITNPDGQYADGSFNIPGCTSALTVIRNIASVSLSAETIEENVTIKVFPNPAGETINVEINSTKMQKVIMVLSDVLGRTFLNSSINLVQGVNHHPLSLHNMIAGSYIVQVKNEAGIILGAAKLIKE